MTTTGDEVFHVYDPGYGGTCIIGVRDTLEAAVALANESIVNNWQPDHGEEWSLDVTGVGVYRAPRDCEEPGEDGALVARATEVDRVNRPGDVDEDGFSESDGDWWGHGYDYMCNYRVEPIPDRAISTSEAQE